LLKDDNAFLLGNTKHLLAKMGLEEEDALFIYEKIGTYVKYMMIDEFQDTSKPDWTNFEVLVNNCLSSKAQSVFIYGDIKQSIYRWNDGDSQIMKDLITNGTNDVVPLKENHRTYGNIVTFNNELFTSLYYPKGTDVTQTAIKGKGKGCVRIQILPKKDNKMAERVWEEVAMYKEKGFEGKDIAILCRKKAQIAEMVKYLRSNGVEAISDTAFLFSSSDAVTKIVSAMKFLNNKDCEVSMEHAFGDYGDITEDVKKDKKAFKCEIKKKLCEKKINYKEMSTIELAIALASFLEVDEDTFFLPAFYDHIHNYMKRESTKWGDFLTYWDDTLCNQAVNNTYKDAIRVTTIHKSKGLQYPIVIVPYCNWGYESEFKNNKFWVENTTRRFAQPLIYATKNQLTDTDFNTEAEKERALEKEDAINTLYVAFTRPKYYLSVLSNIEVDDNNQPKLQTKEGKDIENVATKLYTYTHKTENKWEYEYGTIEDKKDTIGDKKEDEEEKKKTIEVDELDLSNNHPVFSRSKAARNYFFEDEKEKEEAANQKGTRFHNFMEEIIVEKDLEKVLKAWENRGKDTSNIKEVVEKMLAYAKEQKTQWFEGKYKVINERNINPKDEDKKNKDDSFYTIDRLMIGKDKVIVVDYKFTTINNNLAKYKEQVNNYRKLLNNMGYKNIECYLWYVDIIDSDNGIDINTEIIEVKEQ
ncbi:MAG: UvrD-helicase domain-containing protein, partial [Bacteroidales bacterium]|nr:UvrD-helicase domain-containing protein [Bacteroidales bacterium]